MATTIKLPEGATVATIRTDNPDVLAYIERRGLLHLSSIDWANGVADANFTYDDSVLAFLSNLDGETWHVDGVTV